MIRSGYIGLNPRLSRSILSAQLTAPMNILIKGSRGIRLEDMWTHLQQRG